MGKVKKKPKAAKPTEPAALGDVLTLAEVAAYLRVDEAALKVVADASQLPGRVIAGEWRFHRQAIDSWLRSGWGEGADWEQPAPKQFKSTSSLNAGFLSSIGMFADDESLEPMAEAIHRERQRYLVGVDE